MTIVALIDFSAVTDRVFETAANLAGSFKGRVVLFHVVQPSQMATPANPTPEAVEATMAAGEQSADRRLSRYEKRLQLENVNVTKVLLRGVPVPQILEWSTKLGASFLVMGSHGESPIAGRLVGSNTEGVLRQARCPVIVVPHPKLSRSRQPWL
jgi:nucleotide-binding universal stress UspA family protein